MTKAKKNTSDRDAAASQPPPPRMSHPQHVSLDTGVTHDLLDASPPPVTMTHRGERPALPMPSVSTVPPPATTRYVHPNCSSCNMILTHPLFWDISSSLSPVCSQSGQFDACFQLCRNPALFSSPGAYWAPTDLGSSSFSVKSFLPFHTVHGALKARMLKWFATAFSSGALKARMLKWFATAFSSSDRHILSELSTTTHLSWVTL